MPDITDYFDARVLFVGGCLVKAVLYILESIR